MNYYFYYQEKITCLCCDDEENEKNFYIGNINSLKKEFDIYYPPTNCAEGPYQILRRKRGR